MLEFIWSLSEPLHLLPQNGRWWRTEGGSGILWEWIQHMVPLATLAWPTSLSSRSIWTTKSEVIAETIGWSRSSSSSEDVNLYPADDAEHAAHRCSERGGRQMYPSGPYLLTTTSGGTVTTARISPVSQTISTARNSSSAIHASTC